MPDSSQHTQQSIHLLAQQYFAFLAERFPVMCASDEFYFMPRAEEAYRFYAQMDDLDKGAIDECIRRLRGFEGEINLWFEKPVFRGIGRGQATGTSLSVLDNYIDLVLLKSSVSALLIEIEENRSWMRNPLLYLKIGLIGIDHALHKPATNHGEVERRACNRLESLPTLLAQARQNLNEVQLPYHRASFDMIDDCVAYLEEIASHTTDQRRFSEALQKAVDSLAVFRIHMENSVLPRDSGSVNAVLEKTLRDHFRFSGTVSDVFRIARGQWDENLRLLGEIERQSNSGLTWRELYSSYMPRGIDTKETLILYREENRRLRSFFKSRGFSESEVNAPLRITPTPLYLQSVRGSASFSAAFSRDPREESLFYITTKLPDKGAAGSLRTRLHREYRFLTAHETFPGHHLLDHTRRNIENPVRRQIELPLFYEGWASYAESLLLECGYVSDPLERLVLHKRNLWRAARCLVDVGLSAGFMDSAESQQLLESAGFSAQEAASQIRRFRLNPGYQLSYSLGSHEILKLRESCDKLLTNDRFHRMLLEGGELPFSLIGAKLQYFLRSGPEMSEP